MINFPPGRFGQALTHTFESLPEAESAAFTRKVVATVGVYSPEALLRDLNDRIYSYMRPDIMLLHEKLNDISPKALLRVLGETRWVRDAVTFCMVQCQR